MTQQELSDNLKAEAIRNGLCQQWTDEWKGTSQQTLIDMYRSGIDFVLQHNYPPISFINENFSKDILHKNSIFVDEHVTERNAETPVVINGKSHGILTYDGFNSATVYIRHDSNMIIEAKGMAKVWVHVLDNAEVNVVANGASTIYVYPYGENSKIVYHGDVKIRKRQSL